MKIDITLDDWMLIDYCICYTRKIDLNSIYGASTGGYDESDKIKFVEKLDELRRKLSDQTCLTQRENLKELLKKKDQ